MELKEREQVVKDLQEIVDNYSGSWKRFNVLDGALTLIKELTEENDRLKTPTYLLRSDGGVELMPTIKSIRNGTVRKMQERLEYSLCCIPQCHFTYAEVQFHIDRIAKEMLED